MAPALLSWPGDEQSADSERSDLAEPVRPIGQRDGLVNCCDMFGWHANFDHLNIVSSEEDTVANFRRLDYTIARVHAKWRALIFVNQIDPPAMTKDQLKAD